MHETEDAPALAPLLRLPVELRLKIYDHCFIHGPLTLAGSKLPPWWPTAFNSLRCDVPGLARDYMPIARASFDRQLLEGRPNIKDCSWVSSSYKERHGPKAGETSGMNQWTALSSNPGRVNPTPSPRTPAWMLPARCSPSSEPPLILHPTIPSLHLTCRQIHEDLVALRNPHSTEYSKAARSLDLYVSYPEGVCAIAHRYMHLLDQARTVNVAGITYLENPFNLFLHKPDDYLKSLPQAKRALQEDQVAALSRLVGRVNLGVRASSATAAAATAAQPTSFAESPAKPRFAQTPSPRPTLDLRIFYHTRQSSLPPMRHLIAPPAARVSPAAAAFAALHHDHDASASTGTVPSPAPRGDIRVGITDAGHGVLLQIVAAPPDTDTSSTGTGTGTVAFLRPVIIPNMVARAAYTDEDWFRRVSVPHEWEACEREREPGDDTAAPGRAAWPSAAVGDGVVREELPPVYYT